MLYGGGDLGALQGAREPAPVVNYGDDWMIAG
jgi:hypothetical protein